MTYVVERFFPTIDTVGSSGHVTLVGGADALADTSDESNYLKVDNLDSVAPNYAQITFPAFTPPARFKVPTQVELSDDFPIPAYRADVAPYAGLAGAVFWFDAQYEQISGISKGKPELLIGAIGDPFTIDVSPPTFAVLSGGLIGDSTYAALLGDPADFASGTSWRIGFVHDISAVCDFRLYGVRLNVAWDVPTNAYAPLIRYPRASASSPGRPWPRSITRRPGTY